ncbi:uncharacterized protein LOC133918868 [Phragmites australis]|uniref:uncharacterized protein LOC133918868 n=1 Tax=Phragmites australis TaxID=29695 RepID=UPI002D795934|nr:uncharacterized protein LOC133918868 [Phragmites australis]
MGLCISMLQRKSKRRQPEPKLGLPTALFVIRNDGQPSKPEALVFQAHNSGRPRLQKSGKADCIKHEKGGYDCTDVLGRRLCAPKPRFPCGSTRTVTVEPGVTEGRPPMFKGATTNRNTAEECRTLMTPRTPVWQRRILMGTRCELPRFSGLILYDEHGQPLQSSKQNRAGHLISRVRKYESKGKKKTARTTTTLRDLL